jgi:adenylate cyclase
MRLQSKNIEICHKTTLCRCLSYMHGHQANRTEILNEAYAVARKAVMIDPRDADGHLVLGRALWLRREHRASISECLKAVSENPNMAQAYVGLGAAYVISGQVEHAIECTEKAVRLSPHDPTSWITYIIRALAFLIDHRYAGAETAAAQALSHPTAQITAHFAYTASLAHQGKNDEARQALAVMFQMKSDSNASDVTAGLPFENPEHSNILLDGLYKAGMPRASFRPRPCIAISWVITILEVLCASIGQRVIGR